MTATLNLITGFWLAGFGLFGLASQVRELLRARASIGRPAGGALITDARVRGARRGRRTSYNPEITRRYNHRGTEYTGRRLTFGDLTTERTEAESLVERFAVGTRWEVRTCEARPQLSVLHTGVTSRLWSSIESSHPCWALSQLLFCRAESNRPTPAGPPDHKYLAQVKIAWQDLPVIILIYLQRSGR